MGFAPMNKGFAVPAIRLLWYPAKSILIITEPSSFPEGSSTIYDLGSKIYFFTAIFFGFSSSAFLNVTDTIPWLILASGSIDRLILPGTATR